MILLLEYGADPNVLCRGKGLTLLEIIIDNFLDESVTLIDSEKVVLALLKSEHLNS